MIRRLFPALALTLLLTSPSVAQQAGGKPDKPAPTQEELERQLSETLTGATLVGFFTVLGNDSDHPLREDKYTLGKVYKLNDPEKKDLWQFEAKLGYGNRD